MRISLRELRGLIRYVLLLTERSPAAPPSHGTRIPGPGSVAIHRGYKNDHRAIVLDRDSEGNEVLALLLTSNPNWEKNSIPAPPWVLDRIGFAPTKKTYLAPDVVPGNTFGRVFGKPFTRDEIETLRDTFFPTFEDDDEPN
jgi:hypothetical protein